MRSLVAVFVAVVFVLGLAGCSSSEDATSTTPAVTGADTTANAVDAEPEYVSDRSVNDDDLSPVVFPSFTSTDTPAVIQEKLDDGRAMLILFYDSSQNVTKDERAEVDAVMAGYRGLIDLVTYDIGTSDADGSKAVVMYATELGASSTPYILIVDRNGFITYRWKGYLERETLGREVERVTR